MKSTTIVIGDSLACPRPWEGIGLRDTYAYQLQELLGNEHYVINWSMGENSTQKATTEGFLRTYVRAAEAHYAIIQLGIVDCAPRLMSKFERLVGGVAVRLPVCRDLFKRYTNLKARNRLYLTKLFPMTLVSKKVFREKYHLLISEILKWNKIKKVYLINIASPGLALVTRSYGIGNNVDSYNEIINELHQIFHDKTILIDLNSQINVNQDWITSNDGHHILMPAHDWLANTIGNSMIAQHHLKNSTSAS